MNRPQATKETTGSQKLFQLAHEATNQCVQCGYCLPVCPTYESTGREAASPRGRINLVKLAAEGKIGVQENLANPIDLCLGCRACEVACPVGVPYGRILEAAKEVIAEEEAKRPAGLGSLLKKLALSRLFVSPRLLRTLGNLLWLYQKTGLDQLVRKSGLLRIPPEPVAAFEKVLPRLESPWKRTRRGTVIAAKGERKARVAFFAGCIMDAMMYETNRHTVELLSLAGCEVVIPAGQNCCGALHAHQGMNGQARELAKANIEAFERSGADWYVNNAGGCGAMLREYDHLLADEPEWAERARRFVEKARDVTELLVQYGPLPFQREWKGVITYQDSCHLRNVQGVVDPPRQLLKSIPGATYVELAGSGDCCASGGIYNLLHFEESMKILDAKMEKVRDTQAATLVTANPGCLLQMKLGVERMGNADQVRALHIVDVLAEACGIK